MAQTRGKRQEDNTVRRTDWELLTLAALVPLAVGVVLFQLDVPLGKPGTLVYPYSPLVARRILELPVAWLLAGALALGAWLATAHNGTRRAGGVAFVGLGCTAMAVWSFMAVPDHLRQHFFNMQSPSHDGAFLTESRHVADLSDYLREFPQRAATPPEEMKGTRVVSNPPGTTLLALGVRRALPKCSPLLWLADWTIGAETAGQPNLHAQALPPVAFAWVLTALWLLATPFIYLAGRLFLPAGPAAALSVVCLVSPMTLLFTPGKDPAQLLTVAVPLWLWLWACRRGWVWPAAAAGGVLVLSCMVSLVHVWVAAALWVACALHARGTGGRWRSFWLRNSLPALAGALAVTLLVYLLWDWNVLASAWAATRSQAQVTRGPEAMPLVWQVLGLPLFLLFAGPAFWATGLWLARGRVRDDDARFGGYLLASTALAMLVTVGFTNLETPRLWIPFVPLLLLGAVLQLRILRAPAGRAALLLAALVFTQVAISAAQWSLMDMREAEMRLLADDPRFFE
jgi:hypothetical protein